MMKQRISYIPSYVENTEFPIICYKYNKSIRNTIHNFNNYKFLILILKLVLLILESVRILNFVINQRVISSLEI